MLRELLKGFVLGTFTGLTPGIHVNTLAELGGSFGLLFAMGLTHTFLDAFPSTFLGVPDEGTALSILPAHRMVLRGKGREAIWLALLSSLLAVHFTFLLVPVYPNLAKLYTPTAGKAAVACLMAFLLITERRGRRARAAVIMVLSGLLGYAVLRGFPAREPFYHLFTGLFGVPVIMTAMGTRELPEQEAQPRIGLRDLLVFSFAGTLLGMLSSLLPAFTASMGATIATIFSKGDRNFLLAAYSINTSNFLFGILNYSLTGRTRNGVTVAMARNMETVPGTERLILYSLFVGFLAVLTGIYLIDAYLLLLRKASYRLVNGAVLISLISLSLYFDGPVGLWVLATAAAIGYLAGLWGVRRTNCMAVLMVPLLAR